MKRLLSLLLFCNITISFLLAQPVHQVKGTVIDKSSRQPLEFINVMIVGLNKGGVTNAEGKFSIGQVPPGIYRLQASAIGYKTVTTPDYILSTRALHIQIQMEENQKALEEKEFTATAGGGAVEVTISGKREVTKVKLQEEVVDPDDIEMLEDLIVAATNEALRKVEEESTAVMSKLTGGLGGLGGGLPF